MAKLGKKALKTPEIAKIVAALDEFVGGHFDNEGFSEPALTAESEEPVEDEEIAVEGDEADEEDADEEDEESGRNVFDAEEIELAIDAFLTQLIHMGLLSKNKGGSAPSLTDAFEVLFGSEHDILKSTDQFEDHVAGYFGWVSRDDMETAYSYFREIRDKLLVIQNPPQRTA